MCILHSTFNTSLSQFLVLRWTIGDIHFFSIFSDCGNISTEVVIFPPLSLVSIIIDRFKMISRVFKNYPSFQMISRVLNISRSLIIQGFKDSSCFQ